MIYRTDYESPLGRVTLASDGESIVGLWLEGQKYFGDTVNGEMHREDRLAIFAKTRDWLDRYFRGEKPAIAEILLAPAGNRFRQEVWKILCDIPYGEVMTYGAIARMIAERLGREKMSAQAVGGAVGHNPVSIIIPCHRVVGANGSLTGYAGGIRTKIRLLEHEKADMTGLFVPEKSTAP
ncbi:methylated-DNA--[protein]-cysteine S-methyltransferase [Oxalobacter aliiformigenes]|uniref:Methylated-DNA--protein-cysteine methyltransferase n=1 Tax=Oxalobacter aliiformigenes TaxID=2946593 RepID=A0ABY7JK54_9BURK|nr:methylated-DNA--[protein]-cysteine S-methyltransferase [Oxalobacter aliiformigenes]WAV88319.1 methylated-DNA--[protein]-cysteine S-methyltransferase [Oxalobacter aliiformigenes]WAV92393.1 methylated-DNA--[protein]-cysteine S-methyltransferase [Oxalobacter aliiformigenes]WAV96097.1 methylated-DNA--[protein]-cysteine S-methyltransferase [Oxalobacter aliiformigenes]WAV97987.1 methylated-DNA--[protein]-cysteine S-methyltransferase [Oxalobacter aliiformigenes]